MTVRLWGLSEEIEAITAENLRATADMSTVTGQGSFAVPVTVTVSGFSDVTVRGTYELTLTITDTPPQTEPAGPADSGSYTVPARIEVSGYDVGAVGTYEVTVHIS